MRAARWQSLGGLALLLASCACSEESSDLSVPKSLIVGRWKRESPAATFEFTRDGNTIVILQELRQADANLTVSLEEPIKAAGTYRFVDRHTLYIELEDDFRFLQAKGNWKISKLTEQELILTPPSGQPLNLHKN